MSLVIVLSRSSVSEMAWLKGEIKRAAAERTIRTNKTTVGFMVLPIERDVDINDTRATIGLPTTCTHGNEGTE